MTVRMAIVLILNLSIAGTIIGFSQSALQRLRSVALKTRSINNVREICLATQTFACINNNQLPTVDGMPQRKWSDDFGMYTTDLQPILFESLLPYIDCAKEPKKQALPSYVATYISPADPSVADLVANGNAASLERIISYAGNAHAFNSHPNIEVSFPDGTSNTIAYAEHYSWCGSVRYEYTWHTVAGRRGYQLHRPTFADGGEILGGNNEADVFPRTEQGKTSPSRAKVTFQSAPKVWSVPDWDHIKVPSPEYCDWSLPQTPHVDGMIVGMADGSIRIVKSSVAPGVFWSAVTPAGGEAIYIDW